VSAKAVCYAGLAVFVALSFADYILTYALIRTTRGQVGEGNPVAAEWLREHGWAGLAAFKATTVLVVAGAVLMLARRRPQVGVGVVGVACAALVAVNLYSRHLLTQPPPDDGDGFAAPVPAGAVRE
jgi:hypothetical protein